MCDFDNAQVKYRLNQEYKGYDGDLLTSERHPFFST